MKLFCWNNSFKLFINFLLFQIITVNNKCYYCYPIYNSSHINNFILVAFKNENHNDNNYYYESAIKLSNENDLQLVKQINGFPNIFLFKRNSNRTNQKKIIIKFKKRKRSQLNDLNSIIIDKRNNFNRQPKDYFSLGNNNNTIENLNRINKPQENYYNKIIKPSLQITSNKNYINRIVDGNKITFDYRSQTELFQQKYYYNNKRKYYNKNKFKYFGTNIFDIYYNSFNDDNNSNDDYDNDNILWTSQQYSLKRSKRDDIPIYLTNQKDFDTDLKDISVLLESSSSSSSSLSYSPLLDLTLSSLLSTVIVAKNQPQESNLFNDELWNQQWYMQKSSPKPHLHSQTLTELLKQHHLNGMATSVDNNNNSNLKLNLNVIPVYKMGFTGKGIRVAVIDDGIEYDHDDLIQNFDPQISWDCNNDNPNPHPLNRNSNTEENIKIYKRKNYHHGTRCAGEIAMTANNKKCGVGVAFNAKIGGIKLLGGHVYDLIEGIALSFAHNKIDIYSSSWGPTDDGRTLEKPGKFAMEAIKRGIKYGRNGLGSIYVWASGNGGGYNDNCNADGYVNSIYTIAVGSITQYGDIPWYSESCTALMTVTFSSSSENNVDQMISTTDLGNTCTTKHTGTSASAPLAAGIIALGLEANSNLTWRDIQHIIVRSSEYKILLHHKNWLKNSAGYYFNSNFGFGLMNAERFVQLAIQWRTPLPEQIIENLQGYFDENDVISMLNTSQNGYLLKSLVIIHFDYNDSEIKTTKTTKYTKKLSKIRYLEHIVLTFTILCKCRGALESYLKSPSGTQIKILQSRSRDCSVNDKGYINWKLMSVATWSENPIGKWTLYIRNINGNIKENGIKIKKIGSFMLTLYGTSVAPQ